MLTWIEMAFLSTSADFTVALGASNRTRYNSRFKRHRDTRDVTLRFDLRLPACHLDSSFLAFAPTHPNRRSVQQRTDDEHHDENRATDAILCGEGRLYCVQKPRHRPGCGTRGSGSCSRVLEPPRRACSLFVGRRRRRIRPPPPVDSVSGTLKKEIIGPYRKRIQPN
jgi:hypothetical protein